MEKEEEIPKVTESTYVTAILPAEIYNGLVEYVNEKKKFCMSTGLRQAVAFFLQKKTTNDNCADNG
ncbi:MAG: hypothetical protein PHV82_10220 [Victivallaceae bacterium]|nr:hypothetical protein [Victivallaceae bacterium]